MKFFKMLLGFIPPYKGHLILNILFNIISSLLSVFSFTAIIPILQILFGVSSPSLQLMEIAQGASVKEAIEVLMNNFFFFLQEQLDVKGPIWVLCWTGAFLVITNALKNFTSYLSYYYMIPIRTGVMRDLRQSLYSKLTTISIEKFSDKRKGDIISRMTSDTREVESSIMSTIDMLIQDPIKIIVCFITLFGISYTLSLYSILLLIVCGLIVGWAGYSLKRIQMKGQSQHGEIMSTFDEAIGGMRDIKALGAERTIVDKFLTLNNNTRGTFNKMNRRYSIAFPLTDFLVTSTIAILLIFGGKTIIGGNSTLSPSVFIYYLVVFVSTIPPVRDLTKAFYAIHKGLASVERIDAILSEKEAHDGIITLSADDICGQDKDTPIIELKNLYFSYTEDKPTVKDVNLAVFKGQKVAIIGATGAGKSTILNLISRFYYPDNGHIYLMGHNLNDIKSESLYSLVTYVNQDSVLFNDTIFNNIAFGKENASVEEVYKAAQLVGIHDFILSTPKGYDTITGDNGIVLSGGQRQCICLARAILRNTPILLLDESTSAIDSIGEQAFFDSIARNMKGKTVIIVTHNTSILKNIDVIARVQDGTIIDVERVAVEPEAVFHN